MSKEVQELAQALVKVYKILHEELLGYANDRIWAQSSQSVITSWSAAYTAAARYYDQTQRPRPLDFPAVRELDDKTYEYEPHSLVLELSYLWDTIDKHQSEYSQSEITPYWQVLDQFIIDCWQAVVPTMNGDGKQVFPGQTKVRESCARANALHQELLDLINTSKHSAIPNCRVFRPDSASAS